MTSNTVHKNNFDFIRLLASTMVLISHQFAIYGLVQPSPLPGVTLGTLAVTIFFVISGYLISQSWINSPSLWKFLIKRFLRLIPALGLVAILSVFVLGPLVTTLSISEYFSNRITWTYLANIYLDTKFSLPGVFSSSPETSVNSSLWTLPIEATWYLIVALLGMSRLIKFKVFLFTCFILAIYWELLNMAPGGEPRIFSLWFMGMFFIGGMFLNMMKMSCYKFYAALLLSITLYYFDYWFIAFAILLPVSIIYFGEKSFPVLRNITRHGDISYGVYLYAFPVQQTVFFLFGRYVPLYGQMAISLIATYVFAMISWKLIEAPALNLKKYLN